VTPNSRLNAERLARLEGIGFAWSAKNVRKAKSASGSMHGIPASAAAVAKAAKVSKHRANDLQWQEMYNVSLMLPQRQATDRTEQNKRQAQTILLTNVFYFYLFSSVWRPTRRSTETVWSREDLKKTQNFLRG
jgi:hypothetical protein